MEKNIVKSDILVIICNIRDLKPRLYDNDCRSLNSGDCLNVQCFTIPSTTTNHTGINQ